MRDVSGADVNRGHPVSGARKKNANKHLREAATSIEDAVELLRRRGGRNAQDVTVELVLENMSKMLREIEMRV